MFKESKLLVLSLIISILLFCPTAVESAYASDLIGGTTSEISDFQDVDGVYWDDISKTLTLTNVNYEMQDNKIFAFLDNYEGNITVVLNGSNKFNKTKEASSTASNVVIHTATPVIVKGNGSLTTNNLVAIYSKDNITIESGSINTSGKSVGIWTDKTLTVNKAAKIKARNEKTEVKINGENYSVVSHNAINAEKMVNDYSSLVGTLGGLPYNATYKNKNGIYKNYKVAGTNQVRSQLIKYTGGKSADFYTCKTLINGIPQRAVMDSIKPGAFNNKNGNKVTKLAINDLRTTPNGTYKGLKNLKVFRYASQDYMSGLYKKVYDSSTDSYVKTKVIGGKAFKNIGAKNGSKLKVYVGSKKAYKNMVKCGLSKKAKYIIVK